MSMMDGVVPSTKRNEDKERRWKRKSVKASHKSLNLAA